MPMILVLVSALPGMASAALPVFAPRQITTMVGIDDPKIQTHEITDDATPSAVHPPKYPVRLRRAGATGPGGTG
jgi:hypothetical protein